MKKKYVLIIAVIVIAGLIAIFLASVASSKFREKVISTIFKPPKSLIKAKPDYIFNATNFFDTYEADEKQSDSLYIDRIIQVTGPVAEILQEEGQKYTLILRDGMSFSGINCSMDEQFRSEVTNLKPGDAVTIRGVCAGMLMDVVLTRCVIVDVQ